MSGWISVGDRMPELEQRCIIFTEAGDLLTGWRTEYCRGEAYWCFGHDCVSWDFEFNYDTGVVTHWMPLPEPPE